ncbi:carotenoid biosynthesis protein [Pontibacillus sp. HMF3514]|uniref:carotenoid biosynthesis protein n=1 Tax=Pontibacillus sp. HMF3514 TaxID=2692425 RepID=UPI00131F6AFA|nr:carotenoid biosynthesis protein [Pontibacillus sp. HMF3514]QHE51977.1 carotenoid biosynthesis protein [Pontibacillus sp. HMF3514]
MSLWIFRVFLIWYGCGFILLSFNLIPPALQWANAVFLILSGIIGGIYFIKMYGLIKGLAYSLFVGVLSVLVEHVGVQYQWWFGHYTYEQDFGPMVGGVPITIGFAWLMVIAGSHEIAKTISSNRILFVVLGSLLAVMIDLILDPVAFIVKEYWIWVEGGIFYDIPFSNFLGWFFLSLFFHTIGLFLPSTTLENNNWRPRIMLVFAGVEFMFIWLGLLGQIYFASFMNMLLLILWFSFYFKKIKGRFEIRRIV